MRIYWIINRGQPTRGDTAVRELGDELTTYRKTFTCLEWVEFDAGFCEHGDETFGPTGLAEIVSFSRRTL